MIPLNPKTISMKYGAGGVLEHPPVSDTTAPVVTPPADTTIQFTNGGAGLAHNDSNLQSWLSQATATDETSPASPTVTNNLSSFADPLPAGNYTITFSATDDAGNTGTATAALTVSEQTVTNQPPVADFVLGKTGLDITVDASTSTDDVGITTYQWDFGDGSTGTGVTAAHTYAASGSYLVQLTVTDGGGLADTTSQYVNVAPAGSWQLAGDGVSADSHWVAAKMPMHPVYPRPDSETQSHARHRWAHPDFRYEIPIGVQGGAWPFKYEIISAPSGATIGEYYGDPDYGVLKWTPAAGDSGTKTFTVRVTDQELNTVDLTWTTTIDAAAFIFLDAVNGSDSTGDGSISNPFATPLSWHGTESTAVSYPDKIIVYRQGTYYLQKFDTATSWVNVQSGVKPNQHIPYPDETAFLDCAGTGFITNNPSDLFVSVDMGNTLNQQNNDAKCIWVTGIGDRITLLGYISNLGRGTIGNDNPAGYMFGSSLRQNIYIKGGLSGTNSTAAFDIYAGKYVLIEDFTLDGTFLNDQIVFIKSDSSDVSIRNVRSLASFDCGYGVVELMGQEQNYRQENIEICWCWIDGHGGNSRVSIVTHWTGALPAPDRNIWIYRNTLKGQITGLNNTQYIDVDRNIIISDRTPYLYLGGNADVTLVDTNNVFGGTADWVIDSSGQLLEPSRSTYLGIRGHEVA